MRRITALLTASVLTAAAALAPGITEANAPFELNIGSLAPDGTPWREMLTEVEKLVESKSDGRINVILRPPGLMAEVEMVRETRSGERLQGCGVTTAAIAEGGNVPVLQLVELPFLFDNNAEADHVLDDVLWEPFSTALRRRGFILGIWSENGWRSFGTKGTPVKSPADLKGRKMRSQESDVHMAMYKEFGANAVQKPMTEVLTALQSGVIDGLDNTALYTLTGGLAEPLDYFTLTKHIYQPAAILYSRRWFERLPEDLQKIVMEPRRFATDGRKKIRAEEQNMIALFPDMGMKVVDLSDAEREAFKKAGRAMHGKFAASIEGGPETLAMIQKALDAKRR